MAKKGYPASESIPGGLPMRGHSFCTNLAKWSLVADKYAAPGGFHYHTTLPTDALMVFRDVIKETKRHGYANLEARAHELGKRVRACLESHGFKSVAAEGNKAPTVVVSYMRGDQDKAQSNLIAPLPYIALHSPLLCPPRPLAPNSRNLAF